MARFFTCYWKNEFCQPELKETARGEPEYLNHLAGSQFLLRGLKPGDFVYVVTVKKGELFLVGRMEVGEICDHLSAALLLDCPPGELWNAPEHLVAKSGTLLCYDRKVPLDITFKLRCFKANQGAPVALKFTTPGYLDPQTLRSVRELTPESATLFNGLLEEGRV